MHKHPTIRAWAREEDGSYKAEIAGAHLHVSWRPEGKEPRGYSWTLSVGDQENLARSAAVAEEIEHAMVEAEEAAQRLAAGQAVSDH